MMEGFEYLPFTCKVCGKATRVWSGSKAYEFKLCGHTEKCNRKLRKKMDEAD